MGNVYLRKDVERAILRHADGEVGEVVNDILEDEIERRGWHNAPGDGE